MVMGRRPHIVAVPYPAQGHVKPLLSLSCKIAAHGIKVTFVNTEIIHAKVIAALSDHEKGGLEQSGITLESITDGLEDEKDRTGAEKFSSTIRRVMPLKLRDLIARINHSKMIQPVTGVIADATLGWILEAAESVGVEQFAFLPFGPASVALFSYIPKLIETGVMDSSIGTIPENEQISVSKDIPPWSNSELMWTIPGDEKTQKVFFECCLTVKETAEHVNWLLCNTFYELDSLAYNLVPGIIPIGPLQASNNVTNSSSSGSFWLEDTSCLSWLDEQRPGSVIYVAFGSTGVLSQDQFNELALGLELSGQPFLLVVRADIADGSLPVYPGGFPERVGNRGKIVEWAPQEKVLAHPAIACFLSHCGWNSIMEGLSLGVPFLCWPYFADQFHNQKYICDVWKVGLKLNPDENGIRSRHEIKIKIEKLLSDGTMRINASRLKDLAKTSVSKGGSSHENFEKFINHLKC